MFCFFLFCYNFVSFYLFVNNLFFSFLIWNFLCCFKKISSLVSLFFSTIFSFLKLVCSFWQIARLQKFFLLLLFHHLLLPGWGTWMDGCESLSCFGDASFFHSPQKLENACRNGCGERLFMMQIYAMGATTSVEILQKIRDGMLYFQVFYPNQRSAIKQKPWEM